MSSDDRPIPDERRPAMVTGARLLLAGCCLALAAGGSTSRKSGPYDLILEKLDGCEDAGTNETVFPTRLNKVSRDKAVINDMIRISPSIDHNSKLDVELQEWGNQGYRPRAFQVVLKTCDQIWKETGKGLHSMFLTAGANITGCPIPAGDYPVRNLELQKLRPSRIPVMMYNKFRGIINMYHGSRKVGCVRMYVEVVPKGTA